MQCSIMLAGMPQRGVRVVAASYGMLRCVASSKGLCSQLDGGRLPVQKQAHELQPQMNDSNQYLVKF